MSEEIQKILEKTDWAISPDEVTLLQKLQAQGLQRVALCTHGDGRSRTWAMYHALDGEPSVCIFGGFEKLLSLFKEQDTAMLDALATVPIVDFFYDTDEIKKYSEFISTLNKKRKAQGLPEGVYQGSWDEVLGLISKRKKRE